MAKKPLEGIRVVFFGMGIAGPFAQRYLAALGAEVIKIQAGSRMRNEGSSAAPFDPKRGLIPDFPGVGDLAGGFLGLGIELKNPKGLETFKELIKKTDVMLVAYGAGIPKKLGIDYESLKKVKPDLIFAHTPTLGCTGPYSTYDVWGHNAVPMTGLTRVTGYPDLPEPEGTGCGGSTLTDFYGGYSAAAAILMALHYRDKTGKGQFIDIPLFQVTVGTMAPIVLDYTANGIVAGPRGNRDPNYAPHGTYRCKGDDRWVSIAVRTEEEWQGFCRALGTPSLVTDPRFSTFSLRQQNHDELDRLIDEVTSKLDRYDVMFAMQHEGVAAGVVEEVDDMLMADVHVNARDFWTRVPTEKRGMTFTYGTPVKMSASTVRLPRGQAVMSQDIDYILKDVLGKSDEEMAKLIEEGAVNAPIPGDPTLMNRSLASRWTGRLGSSLPRADELKWST